MKYLATILFILILFSCSVYRIVPKTFDGEVSFSCDFKNQSDLNKFAISNNSLYNNDTVIFKRDMVSVDAEKGLVIRCEKSGDKWFSGCLTTWDKDTTYFSQIGGTWMFWATFPDSWSAIWLLHPDYFVPTFNRDFIIPEIDIAENNGGKIDNCVHYGFRLDSGYATKHKVRKMHTPDGKIHEYTLQIKERGYDFYLDGILKNRFRSDDPEFSVKQPFYMILNNATDSRFPEKDTEFVIKSVRVLK
jgi:hypothetical protein